MDCERIVTQESHCFSCGSLKRRITRRKNNDRIKQTLHSTKINFRANAIGTRTKRTGGHNEFDCGEVIGAPPEEIVKGYAEEREQ